MKPGTTERSYLNSPLHGLVQRTLIPNLFKGLHPLPPGCNVLELGCGNGIGAETLVTHGCAGHVTATDIDDASLGRTQFYLDTKLAPNQFSVRKADATQLTFPAERFDAVVSSGVLHHVEDWPQAVAEISRVLKPGGLFYAWEFYKPLLDNTLFQKFFPHPPHRFTHEELLTCLTHHHLTPLAHRTFTAASGMVVAQKIQAPTT